MIALAEVLNAVWMTWLSLSHGGCGNRRRGLADKGVGRPALPPRSWVAPAIAVSGRMRQKAAMTHFIEASP